jgi:hypothetical protein
MFTHSEQLPLWVAAVAMGLAAVLTVVAVRTGHDYVHEPASDTATKA